jgi:hypothetical protein
MSTDRHWSLTLNSDVLRSMIADAWAEIPDDMTGDYDRLADAVAALVEQRDEARAEIVQLRNDLAARVDDRNATAIANVARREGYSDALGDVLDAVDNIPDVFDAEWRLAFLSGWLTARKPVTR